MHSFTEPRDNILRYTDWHMRLNKQWQPVNLLKLDANDKQILAVVENYTDREQAARLTNADIAVNREQLPALPTGQYYWHELIDMMVVNLKGVELGKIVEIMATGANDVLVVEGEQRHLIPYLPGQFVLEVDTQKRMITVDWDADF